ncbi:phage minor capsid protein [Paenibacillus wulumuqiensis]|uniref:phage minor capsid protein n=1 Tax=Paenibacillus wulumuqiensis TaxID=1567107 RepID=UPI000619A8FA|nr:phage minor capsid protein [Paenibacillus wulumuqiensis]
MNPINKIVGLFKSAKSSLGSAVSRLFGRGKVTAADAKAAQQESDRVLKELRKESDIWVRDNLTKAAKDGVAKSMFDLKEARSLLEAADKAKLNKPNREMLALMIQQTNADVLQVTNNMDRRMKLVIQQTLAESLRSNFSQGVNTSGSIAQDVLARLRRTAGVALDTGIVDAAGRRWKPEVYVEMLVQTKMAETARQATINDALEREVYYGIISSHGAKDMCRNWEGRIVKLVADAPGDYPYIGDLPTREIFHPRCRHTISPIRNPQGG